MTNEGNNTTEEQKEIQTSAAETTNNETAGAAVKATAAMTEEPKTSAAETAKTESAEGETKAETKPSETSDTVKQSEPKTTETAESTETKPAEKAETKPTQTVKTVSKPAAQPKAETEKPAEKTETQEIPGDIDFGAILEQFEPDQTPFKNGDSVTGRVIEISERGVLIDFGYKSEGIAPTDDFTNKAGEMTVKEGDEVEVIIKNIASNDAPPMLSYSDAKERLAWDKIETAYRKDEPVIGHITGLTKGGLNVDVAGIECFMPGSQVDSRPNVRLEDYVDQDIEAKILRFSRAKDNIVLSRKVITDEEYDRKKKETLDSIEENYVVEGTITNLLEYGAFIDIGGIDGLLHITDMSWGRTPRPSDIFKVGETIQVKILKLNRQKEKISLGYKQLIPDPWETVPEIYPVASRVEGRVTSVTDYGAFVELEPGVEGLVHVSEMSYSKRISHPKAVVKRNEEIEVQVLGIDLDERRISLGIKQLQPDPWDTFLETYQAGDKIRGEIRNLTDFGAFVEVIPGVEGLVHLSDISWSRRIDHPKDVLKRGQEIDAVITKITPNERKISLSMKELTPTSWETFTATHKTGDVIKGKITRFANFGVFVEITDDLEGLCHISELTEGRIDNPEDEFKIGQELEFKILRIEPENQKIGLSHRAVTSGDVAVADSKLYSTQAKGGMASLGELANLKFGKSEDEETEKPETKKEAKARAKAEKSETSETSQETTADESSEKVETGETTEADKNEEETAKKADSEADAQTGVETEDSDVSDADVKAEDKTETDEPKVEENKAETTDSENSETEVKAETSGSENEASAENSDTETEAASEEEKTEETENTEENK